MNQSSGVGGRMSGGGGLNGPCYAKLLVTSGVAGSIIGKSGSEISNIEKQTNCNIRLSNTDSYFPSSLQRICVISGTLQNLSAAIVIILTKVRDYAPNAAAANTATGGAASSHIGGNGTNGNNNIMGGVVEGNNMGGSMRVDAFGMDHHLAVSSPVGTATTPSGAGVMLPGGGGSEGGGLLSDRFTCIIAVPKTTVSAIIGRGGQAIKNLAETTGAKVVVSERDNGLSERLVYFTGTFESVKNAALSIVQTIQDDTNLRECSLQLDYRPSGHSGSNHNNSNNNSLAMEPGSLHQHQQYHHHHRAQSQQSHYNSSPPPPNTASTNNLLLPFVSNNTSGSNNPSAASAPLPSSSNAIHSNYPNNNSESNSYPGVQSHILQSPCEIFIHIPDSAMGAIIGKQGSCMSEIMRRSGAKISVSQKGDLVPGTINRQVTISGPLSAVQYAHAMLLQHYMVFSSNPEDGLQNYSNGSPVRRDYNNNYSGLSSVPVSGKSVFGTYRDDGSF